MKSRQHRMWMAVAVAAWVAARTLTKVAPGEAMVFRTREWMLGAIPFFGIGILAVLQAEVVTLLLGWLSGPIETGLFQPVFRISIIMLIVIIAIIIVINLRTCRPLSTPSSSSDE